MNTLISRTCLLRMRHLAWVAALLLSVVSVPAQAILSGTYIDVEVTGRKQKILDGQGMAITLYNTGDSIISGSGSVSVFTGYEATTIPIIWLRAGAIGKIPANTNIVFEGATLSFNKDGIVRGTNDLTIVKGKT